MNAQHPTKGPSDAMADRAAEAEVLGSLLLAPALLEEFAQKLQAEDFHDPRHATIFRTMQRFVGCGEHIDTELLLDELRADELLEQAGGVRYLESLPDSAQPPEQARSQMFRVLERARRRKAHGTLLQAAQLLQRGEPPETVSALLWNQPFVSPKRPYYRGGGYQWNLLWQKPGERGTFFELWETDLGVCKAQVRTCEHEAWARDCWTLSMQLGPLCCRVECHPDRHELQYLAELFGQGLHPGDLRHLLREVKKRAREREARWKASEAQRKARAAREERERERRYALYLEKAVTRLAALTGLPREKLVDEQGRVRRYLHGDQAEHDPALYYSLVTRTFVPYAGFAHDGADVVRLQRELAALKEQDWYRRPESPTNLFLEQATNWRVVRYFDEQRRRWAVRCEPPEQVPATPAPAPAGPQEDD